MTADRRDIATADAPAALRAQTDELRRDVVTVTDRVHVAVGFGLANSIMIDGDGGRVIVDALGSVESGRAARRAFDRISQDPVAALLYTHNHADHVLGAAGIAGDDDPTVLAHTSLPDHVTNVLARIRPVITRRSMRQFGVGLDADDGFLHAGIGPRLDAGAGGTPGFVAPTRLVEDRLEVEIAGIRLEVTHAPGETPDQLMVWLPDDDVLLPGDNFYRAFPNLYAIRGTRPRDPLAWVASLDRMRDLQPRALVASHTRPVVGREAVAAALTDYRDAIQTVHDQTVQGMNAGRGPDELAATVALPPHLASSPFLREVYGTVAWSVRAIYDGYLGWFDGDPARLDPLAPRERAARVATLAGGADGLREHLRDAVEGGEHRWALELAGTILRLAPGDDETRRLRATSLRALAAEQTSTNGRNYLLALAREDGGADPPDPGDAPPGMLAALPVATFMAGLPVRLDREAAADLDISLEVVLSDTDETWRIHVRRGVAEVRPVTAGDPDVTVTLPAAALKALLVGGDVATGDVAVHGDRDALTTVLGCFGG